MRDGWWSKFKKSRNLKKKHSNIDHSKLRKFPSNRRIRIITMNCWNWKTSEEENWRIDVKREHKNYKNLSVLRWEFVNNLQRLRNLNISLEQILYLGIAHLNCMNATFRNRRQRVRDWKRFVNFGCKRIQNYHLECRNGWIKWNLKKKNKNCNYNQNVNHRKK